MIESFGNRLAEDLFYDRRSRATRSFPSELRRVARRKLLYVHDVFPSNRSNQSFNEGMRYRGTRDGLYFLDLENP